MKITINKTTTETLEIEAPMFWHKGSHYYTQFNEEYCIQVYFSDVWCGGTSICMVSYDNGFSKEWEETTEEKYNKVFNKALKQLQKKITWQTKK